MSFKPPNPPYVGPPKFHGSASNKPIRLIVLHGTVSPCVRGGARTIARYFKTTVSNPSSCHYIVDPGETLQLTYDSVVAYHDGTNVHEIGIELCDPVTGSIFRWDDKNHRAMLRRAARLVAELCLAYDVPVAWRGVSSLKAGKHGITDHDNMSKAFRRSTHWDLGAFRRRRFMRLVRAEVADLKGGVKVEPSKPKRPTRVTRAGAMIEDALDILASVRKSRKWVHKVAQDMRHDADRLPNR